MDNQFTGAPTDHTNKEEPFKTPEQVAARDTEPAADPLVVSHHVDMPKSKTKKLWSKLWPPNKYTWIALAVLIILLGGLGYWLTTSPKPIKKAAPIIVNLVPKPTTVASSLTGLQVSPATNKLPITAVMVENSTFARPQSGLGKAGVVFEALAEGGITRYVAIYQGNDGTSIGPVRSARPYFISWMMGFDAAYAHVGGSPEALSDITAWGVKDMNEFYNGGSFQRISTRQAPHNVYTTLAELYSLEQSKGYTTSTFTSWPRKAAQPLKMPTASTIALTMSGPDYNVNYTFAPTTNSYNRNVGGAADIDMDTNKQISPPVVIAIVVPESAGALDSSGAYYSEYATVGSGAAYVFQDGGVTIGQWSKSSNSSQIMFTDSSGKAIPLNPGEVWVTAVTTASAVSYN